jgi:hypothetical protein
MVFAWQYLLLHALLLMVACCFVARCIKQWVDISIT